VIKNQFAKGARIDNTGAQIANLKSTMERRVLTKEEMAMFYSRHFYLAMK
jgi:hypothetical protein